MTSTLLWSQETNPEEVIVTTGYSTIRRKSFTGSAKIVTQKTLLPRT